jgi:hypothetical protein
MAKQYEVKCPHCQTVRTMSFSDLIAHLTDATGMRGPEENKSKQRSRDSIDEKNWIDLKKPCPFCQMTFSFNFVTGESRE